MKNTTYKIYLSFVTTTILFITAVSANALDAADILKKSDNAEYSKSTKIYMTQTVITPSGDKREFKMVSYSQNGNEKGLTEYLTPNQVAGMKILTLNDGDDIWSYFPRTNRTRKIASSARNRRVQGSDFTYEDMAQGKLSKSWKGTLGGNEEIDGKQCYKIFMVPTANGPKSYKKAVIWIDKNDFVPRKILYFDNYGEKLKELTLTSYKKISGVWIPQYYVMTNLKDGGKTIIKIAHAQVNIKLDANIFTEAALEK
jgi:outer membrane lipoprotein-sorting protein